MSRDGHQGPCDLLAARNRPEEPAAASRVPQRTTRLRFIHPLASFSAVFFCSFLWLYSRESVRAREVFGHVLFSSATSELKARSLHRDFTAGYRKELEQIEFRVSHLRLCFCLSRKATWRLGRGLPSKSLGCLVSCSSLLLVGVFSADTLSCGSGAAHLWL